MTIFDCMEEIIMTHSLCNNEEDCSTCRFKQACLEVFEKNSPVSEIEELVGQCKAFNEFARANKKGN